MRNLLVGLILIPLLAVTVLGEEKLEPVRLPIPEGWLEPKETWFGVYVSGKKIGYEVNVLRKAGDSWVSEIRTKLRFAADGDATTMWTREVSEYAGKAPHRLIRGTYTESLGDSRRQVVVVNGPKELRATIRTEGEERVLIKPAVDIRLTDEASVALWLEGERKTGSVRRVIRTKKGDCTEHAMLFACLARAVGIPARDVGGLVYGGDDMKAFGWHAWNEVVLDGHWVQVDPSWGETKVNATHIRLESEDDSGMTMFAVFGQLEFRLVEVKRKVEKPEER